MLARIAGAQVIGTASPRHFAAVRALGATPVDYATNPLEARVRELAPGGCAAVFDHVGGESVVRSHRLLAPRGRLVVYGSASTRDAPGSSKRPILVLSPRLTWWSLRPDGRRARFFNVWAGQRRSRRRFHARVRHDLAEVLGLLADGQLRPQVAARYPLGDAAAALRLAESRAVVGRVVLTP